MPVSTTAPTCAFGCNLVFWGGYEPAAGTLTDFPKMPIMPTPNEPKFGKDGAVATRTDTPPHDPATEPPTNITSVITQAVETGYE